MPREVNLFVKSLPATIRSAAEASLVRNRAVAPSDARILGRAYVKQVDVLIAPEPGTVERAIDMLRKLRAEADVYDGTCLLVAEWSDANPASGVRICHDAVPDDLSAARFLATLVDAVLERTPVEMHVEVRQRREHRNIPLDEGDTP